MLAPTPPPEAESLRALVARLVDEAKAYAKAELDYWKAVAGAKARGLAVPVALLVVATFIVQAALTTLLVGGAVALTPRLGPFGAGALVALIGVAVAGLLAWIAIGRLGGGK